MRIWLIKTGEPLSIDGDGIRVFRMGILARQCADAGHDTTFWSSTFFHQQKRFRAQSDHVVDLADNYRMRLIHTRGYRKNVSLARLWDHRQLERKFAEQARRLEPPDLILSAIPIPGLCRAATAYGREAGVPVVLDVRDLWPDVFYDLLPASLQWLGRLVTAPIKRASTQACSEATAILGVTPDYVQWGLDHAGREAGGYDRAFPMGYSATPPADAEIDAARGFWYDHGVTDDGAFTACFFGWLGHQFEIEPVLDAARRLQDSGRAYRFVICGNGDLLERYREMSADLPGVLFPGFVNAPHIWTLMRMSQVGLAPYNPTPNFLKNVPNKPIEYMSGSLPIVTCLGGALAELLREHECGVTYESGDGASLARVLEELAGDPDRRLGMAHRAQAIFEKRFVAERVYAGMIEHLQKIADDHAAGRRPS